MAYTQKTESNRDGEISNWKSVLRMVRTTGIGISVDQL